LTTKAGGQMETKQFNYLNGKESIERFPEDFVKSFYLRPKGDCGWKEYGEFEKQEGWLAEIYDYLEGIPVKKFISSLLIVYSKESEEVSAIIEFSNGEGFGERENKVLIEILTTDANNVVRLEGIDNVRLVFIESY
jgi:hypothetical protein